MRFGHLIEQHIDCFQKKTTMQGRPTLFCHTLREAK